MIASECEVRRVSVNHTSSPFPSPSSAFLPPPIPNNHEFANKAAWTLAAKRKNAKEQQQQVQVHQPEPEPEPEPHPTSPPADPPQTMLNGSSRPVPDGIDTAAANALLSPTLSSTSSTTTPTQHSALSALTPATPGSSHSHRSSLSDIHPSRAAPPSPAPSRRGSMRRSTSSRKSNSKSSISSFTPSKARKASAGEVKIRDFAFPEGDPRHVGVGAPPDDKDGSASSSRRSSGWGSSFRWSGIAAKLPWARSPSPSPQAEVPTQSDFDRNFTDDGEYEDGEEEEYFPDEAEELRPGFYRALYAFEPEGTAEMALREDQRVRVLGRGGGVGWAVARMEGGEGCALVPESYLEWLAPFGPGEEEGYDDAPAGEDDDGGGELVYASQPMDVDELAKKDDAGTPKSAARALPG
ncbi:hypothetical protein AURDEDRAFT_115043 [Auricularia subglabra TFB-10046 SS5]|nr:hypothetical protein AURDEDRAFT_115043 [Auricularia subglabra TFB-10046 SS5]